MLNMVFGGLSADRMMFESELLAPAPAPVRPAQAAPLPRAARALMPPQAAPLEHGRTVQRTARFASNDLNAMLELTGPQAARGLLEGLLASHLLGCAVANAAEAAPHHAVITLNHRVMCKGTAASDTEILIASHVLRADWNHRLQGWVAELEAEATSVGQVLMSAVTTLLVKPGAA